MRTQEEELSLKNWRRAYHLSTQFNDEPIQSVKHGPGCTATCRQPTSRLESVIPISKDGCTTIMLWIDLGYQRGIPTYPWLRKLIYCYGIRSSRLNFFAQWICLSVAYCHGWNTRLTRSFRLYQFARPTCLCCLYNHCCLEHVLQDVRNHVRYLSESELARNPTKLNVAFNCLHQREGG